MEDLKALIKRAEQDRREAERDGSWDGRYRLSVFGDAPRQGESVDQVIKRVLDDQPVGGAYVRATRAARLREAGFELVATPPDPYHYDAVLGTEVTPSVVERFAGAFEPKIRRPA